MFKTIDPDILVSPQIDPADVAEARDRGIELIINNRPEGESDDQTPGEAIEAAAQASGIAYVSIPVTHAGFSQWQVDAMVAALESAKGPVLAYCRSGTRSTLLWALARARMGDDPDQLASKAGAAGYDVGPVRPVLDMIAANRS
ncbi:TIGR01244 family sulfur transferase [Novosphingobium aquimarinum]|uniref:TIGR01244 family sulfur transferase n=1 Tax=Novosphingobium aquimarinum TaxID=2682494 RepID=UPI0012EB5DF6|nr:TIGR01244 family sulfur transferase [Novosphingobium aquimarinum]